MKWLSLGVKKHLKKRGKCVLGVEWGQGREQRAELWGKDEEKGE